MSIAGAFIVPHPPLILEKIGNGEEKKIQKTIDSYREIARKIKDLKPDTIVISSPHSIMYTDYFHISPGKKAYGDFGMFGRKDIIVQANYDTEFVSILSSIIEEREIKAGVLGERDKKLDHGTMIPIYFINEVYSDYQLVRIGLSGLSFLEHYKLGKCIQKAADILNKKIVFIASGDLSHKLKEEGPYGYAKEGPEYDKKVTKAMEEADFLSMLYFSESFCEKAAECGHRSFLIMAGTLDGKEVESKLLSYEGPFGVGYATASFFPVKEDKNRRFEEIYKEQEKKELKQRKEKEDSYVKLARLSLETYVKENKIISASSQLQEELLKETAGVFVSLKKQGQLRGCIGTIFPTKECVAKEIIENAISSGTKDPRFSPVTKEELEELVYSVDILKEPEKIVSKEELDVKKYGVIVSKGYKKGLLLPNLEGVDTIEQQLEIALQKAGIKQEENYQIERFEVVRHN